MSKPDISEKGKIQDIRNSLFQYCEPDTFAMVMVYVK